MNQTVPVKERLRASGVVAVLRAPDARHLLPAARVLAAAGISALEVTLTTEGALEALASIREELDDGVVVGAGTVLTPEQVDGCVRHGAEFLVSPVVDPDVVRAGQAATLPVYPGALTPTEFRATDRLGADLVKLFPAHLVGPGYLADLRGPLPDLDVMPTGGIGLYSIGAWLAAGAVAVGVGGPLLGDALRSGDLDSLADRAAVAAGAVHAARRRGAET